ncbi:hypothetical protein BST61_g1201 [Cercospora zeina]
MPQRTAPLPQSSAQSHRPFDGSWSPRHNTGRNFLRRHLNASLATLVSPRETRIWPEQMKLTAFQIPPSPR